jgi:asparagine synthase (glutamine-hydrolysing)
MCGIAGITGPRGFNSNENFIKAATSCQQHRGPECQQHWINTDQSVALGHARLSIIDLSDRAAQPFHYQDRFTIVHNGELYNYRELKSELAGKGYDFKTDSDTEVIVAAYACWNENCLEKFDGMFAFALWDEIEQTLFAARDRLGEKPFYYHFNDGILSFASEIGALWKMNIAKEVNRSMLYNFLTLGYTSNPTDNSETFYKGIYKLPAAHFIKFRAGEKTLQLSRYWELATDANENISDETAIEMFDALLKESVRIRMRSDVPIGTSLSGGLDSSSIVAISNSVGSDQYSHKCFTAVFPGYEKNEEAHAKLVAEKFGLEQHLIKITEDEIPALMEKVMRHQQEPIGSASGLAQYKVYEKAKQQGVTVLLDGQGADEILAGYHKYYKWYWQELYQKKQLSTSGELNAARAIGVKEKFGWHNKIAAGFPHLAAALLQSKKGRSFPDRLQFDREFYRQHSKHSYYSLPSHFTLNSALYYNTVTLGLEELLRIADRNSMAHAVEVRLPFLSHHLVEFLFSLPPHFKIRNGWTKWLLRKTTEKYLPAEITWRKDKVGFDPPQKLWTSGTQVQEAIMEGKNKLVKHGVLNPSALQKKIQPHEAFAAVNDDWKYWSVSFLY